MAKNLKKSKLHNSYMTCLTVLHPNKKGTIENWKRRAILEAVEVNGVMRWKFKRWVRQAIRGRTDPHLPELALKLGIPYDGRLEIDHKVEDTPDGPDDS